MLMIKNIAWTVVLVSLAYVSYAGERHECRTDQACLTVASLKAAASALQQFQKDQPNAVLDNFTIVIGEMSAHFEIEFVPDSIPTKVGSNGDTNFIEVPSGSGNRYGRDVMYEVSKKGDKILKTIFSK
jgi:hypothetical protein